jgi:hypothetical protein
MVIELAFDMLRKMPAIPAWRYIRIPPHGYCVRASRPPAFSLITLAEVTVQPRTKALATFPA